MLLHCNIYAFTSQYHNFLIPISLSSSFCSIFPFPHSASIAPLCQSHYRLIEKKGKPEPPTAELSHFPVPVQSKKTYLSTH